MLDTFVADTYGNAGTLAESRAENLGTWRPSDPATAQLFGLWPSGPELADTAGIYVDEDLALSVSAAFACVQLIAQTLASCPTRAILDDGSYSPSPHPHGKLFLRPNRETTWFSFVEGLVANACLSKLGGVAEIVWGANGVATELHLLDSRRVRAERRAGQLVYLHREDDNRETPLYPEDVLHLRGCFARDGVLPVDRTFYARRDLAIAIAQARFAASYFNNATAVEGVIEHPSQLSPEAGERLARGFTARRGNGRQHGTPILEEGAKFVAVNSDAQKAQLTESRKHQVLELCRYYQTPPALIGVLEANSYASVEMAAEMFKQFAMAAWGKRLDAELDLKLMYRTGSYAKTNLDAVLRGSTGERQAAYSVAVAGGWLDENEARALEDRPPDPSVTKRDNLSLQRLELEVEKLRLEVERAKSPPEPPPAPDPPVEETDPDVGETDPPVEETPAEPAAGADGAESRASSGARAAATIAPLMGHLQRRLAARHAKAIGDRAGRFTTPGDFQGWADHYRATTAAAAADGLRPIVDAAAAALGLARPPAGLAARRAAAIADELRDRLGDVRTAADLRAAAAEPFPTLTAESIVDLLGAEP